MRHKAKPILILLSLLISTLTFSQDPSRFVDEIDSLLNKTANKKDKNPIVFAGSSSFRLWVNLEETFPDNEIVNHGFGGSHTSDLVCYAPLLIFQYKPSKIFIYEGDNDLAEGKSVDLVVADIKTLIRGIRRRLPAVPIYIVSPKPSIKRWDLKEQYIALNKELEALCLTKDNVTFIDIWKEMVSKNGELKEDLFIKDSLHMNDKGYEIWAKALSPYVE